MPVRRESTARGPGVGESNSTNSTVEKTATEAMMQETHERELAAGSIGSVESDWRTRDAESRVDEAARSARKLADKASRTLDSAKESVNAAYERTAEKAGRVARKARDYAQENPGTAAAVTFAAGIGLGLGLMVARRNQNGWRAYRRGLVPVMAVALARTVLDVFDETQRA